MTAPRRAAPLTLLALSFVAGLAGCASVPDARERKSAEIHHDIGLEALRAGRAPEALKEFDLALESDSRFAEAWLGKGLVLEFAFDKLADAEMAYRRAIELKPAFPEAQNNLGQLLARTGRTPEALRAFDAALAEMSYREPWVARCNRGQALYRASRREEGLAELRGCVTLQPAYCAGRRTLGKIYLEEGKVKEALEEFNGYVRFCEKVADAHYQLGLAHMKAGNTEAAKTDFERCAALGVGAVVGEECRKTMELLQ